MKTKWYDTRVLFEVNQFAHPDRMAAAMMLAGFFGILSALAIILKLYLCYMPDSIALFLAFLCLICIGACILMIVMFVVTSKMIERIHYPNAYK